MEQSRNSISDIFNARSVAVVGASANPVKWGYKTLKCIIDGGYQGQLYAVNPKETQILGVPTYPSVQDLPGPVDLLVILVSASQVSDVLKQGLVKGVKGAAIISSGFREAGRADLEEGLSEIVRNSHLRLIGPNIQGFNYVPNKLCSVILPLIKKSGPVSIIAQSGSVSATLAEWGEREGIGLTGMVNLGNQVDLCESDFLDFFAEDERTHVILLYLEGPKNGAVFKEALKRATARKPVVILKPGRSQAGRLAASTHTASIAGNDLVFGYACRQYGATRALNMEDFYDAGKIFALQSLSRGKRVLVLTTSGGAGILTMDAISEEGLEPAPIPRELADDLKANTTATGANYANPMDLPYLEKSYWQEAVEIIARYQIADSVIFSIADAVPGIEEVIKYYATQVALPLAVAYMGGGEAEISGRNILQASGIPVYPTPERAVRALAELTRYSEFRRNQ